MQEYLQRSAKRLVSGCEKFVPALAYLFCLPLPGSCLATFAFLLADLCSVLSQFFPQLFAWVSKSIQTSFIASAHFHLPLWPSIALCLPLHLLTLHVCLNRTRDFILLSQCFTSKKERKNLIAGSTKYWQHSQSLDRPSLLRFAQLS